MKKKIDAVKLMRDVRATLGAKYGAAQGEEMRELRSKFGHLKKRKEIAHAK